MNDDQKANALRIAAYLENRLSPEERESFKRLLGEDDELRRQYVEALMNRAGTGQSSSDAGGSVSDEEAAMDRGIGDADNVVLERATNFGIPEPEPVHQASVPENDNGGSGYGAPAAEETHPIEAERHPIEADQHPTAGEWRSIEEENHPTEQSSYDVRSEHTEDGDTAGNEPGGGWQSVGEQGAREAWEAGWPGGKNRSRSGFLGSGWMVAVTLGVLVIAAVVIYVFSKHHEFWEKTVATIAADSTDANKNKVDSAAAGLGNPAGAAATGKTDSARRNAAGGATGATGGFADTLFAKLYKPYIRGDDPIAVRVYYQDYRTGNYDAVFAAGDSLVSGPSAAKYPTRNYIRLYKGLSYLATGKAPDATTLLADVVLRTKPGDELYDAARWYLALAWLKRNDVDAAQAKDNALGLAKDIAHGYSRYREPAREMVKGLE